MKEQSLTEYLNKHKFKSVFVVSTPEHDTKRAQVIDIIKDTLGVVAIPGIMEGVPTRSKLFEPHYKITNMDGKSDRKLLFTSELTIGISDGCPVVLRVDLKHGGSTVGNRFGTL